MSNIIDLTGKRFWKLTVIKLGYYEKHKPLKWLCKCDCGNLTLVQGATLKAGRTKSCGCYASESILRAIKAKTTHAMSRKPIYIAWCNMKSRCENPKNGCFIHYGARGIKVCDKWQTFEGFYQDMGDNFERGLTLERINVDGDYCKENCRWATMKEQNNNKRNNRVFTIDGITDTLKNLCSLYNINYHTAYGRLQKGLSIERILKEPLQCGIKFNIFSTIGGA